MDNGFRLSDCQQTAVNGGLTASARRVHCPLFWIQLMSNALWLSKEVWSHLNTKGLSRGSSSSLACCNQTCDPTEPHRSTWGNMAPYPQAMVYLAQLGVLFK